MSKSKAVRPRCLHREEQPIRGCGSCGAYLTSGNPTEECWKCGRWGEQPEDKTPWEMLAEASSTARAEFFAEVMETVGIAA